MVNPSALARHACAVHAQHDEPMLPEPIDRPALAHWLWRRGIDFRAAGALFGVSHQTVYFWCLPFGDVKRTEPRAAQAERIARVTQGEIGPESFKDPAAERVGSREPAR